MALGMSATEANATLSAMFTAYPWIQKHIGAPGAAGTTSPAVDSTRKSATWAAPSGGVAVTSADLNWTSVAAAETYTHFSAWSLASGGVFGFSGTITGNSVHAGDNVTAVAGSLSASLPIAS